VARRSRFPTACLAASITAAPATAYAFPTSRLIYDRGAGAEHCPEEPVVRGAVADRLGYDPFVESATRTIVARVLRVADRLEAKVELVDQLGTRHGSREFSTDAQRCDELISAMALSISIAIDPERAQAAADPLPSPPPMDPKKPGPKPPKPRPEPRPEAPKPRPPETSAMLDNHAQPAGERSRGTRAMRWYSGAGGHAALGSAPGAAAGAFVFAGVLLDKASLSLEGRADAPASSTVTGGAEVGSSLLLLSAVPCFEASELFACALISAGSLRATGDRVTNPGSDSAFYAAAGGRLGTALPFYGTLSFRLHLDLLSTLTRVTLEIDQREVWQAPQISGAAGIGLRAHFP
jgi:hypothetical protein